MWTVGVSPTPIEQIMGWVSTGVEVEVGWWGRDGGWMVDGLEVLEAGERAEGWGLG